MLIRTAHSTLTEQLAERFAERIRSRLLPAGARLPSVRDCARQQGVSPYTVVAAYDQLLAQGLVESRRQRGFYVRDLTQKEASDPYGRAQAAIKSAANEERLAGPLDGPLPSGSHINATALIRGMFHQASSKPQPGTGVMPATWVRNRAASSDRRLPPSSSARSRASCSSRCTCARQASGSSLS